MQTSDVDKSPNCSTDFNSTVVALKAARGCGGCSGNSLNIKQCGGAIALSTTTSTVLAILGILDADPGLHDFHINLTQT